MVQKPHAHFRGPQGDVFCLLTARHRQDFKIVDTTDQGNILTEVSTGIEDLPPHPKSHSVTFQRESGDIVSTCGPADPQEVIILGYVVLDSAILQSCWLRLQQVFTVKKVQHLGVSTQVMLCQPSDKSKVEMVLATSLLSLKHRQRHRKRHNKTPDGPLPEQGSYCQP